MRAFCLAGWDDIIPQAELERIKQEDERRKLEEQERERVCKPCTRQRCACQAMRVMASELRCSAFPTRMKRPPIRKRSTLHAFSFCV